MTRPVLHVVAAMLCSLHSFAIGPGKRGRQDANGLELRLKATHLRRGLPKNFAFVLVNNGDVAVRLPKPPGVNASELELGSVSFRCMPTYTVQPLTGGVPGGTLGAVGGLPSALWRARNEWLILYPGEMLEISIPPSLGYTAQKHLLSEDCEARYGPPGLSPEEQQTLTAAGIRFPYRPLSTHRVFRNTRP